MVALSSSKNGGTSPWDMESPRLLSQRGVLLVLMLMILLPFVLSRFFISHITFFPTAKYAELSSSPSLSLANVFRKSGIDLDADERAEQSATRNQGLVEQKQMEFKKKKKKEKDQIRLEAKEYGASQHIKEVSGQQNSKEEGDPPHEQVAIDDPVKLIDFTVGGCDIWNGRWIPHKLPPAYTNATCQFIQGHQDCLKNGRPDIQYLQWRWKPHDCELPLFDGKEFLDLVRGKAWAFMGDSIARNHFQSFLCFLDQVESPEIFSRDDKDLFVRWFFPSYNFTLAVFWSPFLVQWTEKDVKGLPPGMEKVRLDKVDKHWASSIHDFDYVVLSGGHWFMKPSIYFMKNKVIGCHYCPGANFTELGLYYGFQVALQTVYDYFLSSSYKGVVLFRTFTPDHFEFGQWHEGGNCMRTLPTHNATLSGVTLEMYRIQLKAFSEALQRSKSRLRLKIVDTIHASILRADGHPGPWRIAGASRDYLPQDCLHWCLPGPIDTWSAMILEILRHMH